MSPEAKIVVGTTFGMPLVAVGACWVASVTGPVVVLIGGVAMFCGLIGGLVIAAVEHDAKL